MNLRPEVLALTVAIAFIACVANSAVKQMTIETSEVKTIRERIESSDEFQRAAARQKDSRLVFVGASKYANTDVAAESAAIVEAVYYKYEGGITIRATTDSEGKLLKLEELEAYPTPLTPEEQSEAVRLANEKSEEVRAISTAAQGELVVEALAPVVADPADPRYGHRLVLLTFYPRSSRARSVLVEVDLTQGSVRRPTANG